MEGLGFWTCSKTIKITAILKQDLENRLRFTVLHEDHELYHPQRKLTSKRWQRMLRGQTSLTICNSQRILHALVQGFSNPSTPFTHKPKAFEESPLQLRYNFSVD